MSIIYADNYFNINNIYKKNYGNINTLVYTHLYILFAIVALIWKSGIHPSMNFLILFLYLKPLAATNHN